MGNYDDYEISPDEELAFDMNGTIEGYYPYNDIYIKSTVWTYMQQEDLTFEKVLNEMGLDFDEAVADREDVPRLDAKRKQLMRDRNFFDDNDDE
ncbi:hypothetical protein MXL83_06175 [Staphylococcus epidermidis]|uniref:hypothetical protein n=1 Tax=Staphylococcus epidermidis TaxID=1282 RepID=UPI002DBFCF77|nr:hypothetical protein [Staphylococcus epidermidis]MEB6268375.1 hypothetical protein [Staphylococcus epidermidis]